MNTAPTVSPGFARDVYRSLNEQQVDAALKLAADGVRAYPAYLGGYVLLADCYHALGHPEAAAVILDEAERRFPNRQAVHSRRHRPLPATSAPPVEHASTPEAEHTTAPEAEHISTPEAEHISTPEAERTSTPAEVYPLRMIDLAPPLADTRVIRSSSMRLIPGLEFTSLRFEGTTRRGGRALQFLPEPPGFRDFHEPRPIPPSTQKAEPKEALERLAERISRVRMSADDLEKRPPAPAPAPSQNVAMHSETLVRIYMQQQHWDKAIASLLVLQQTNPEDAERLQGLVDECERRKTL
jgi:tetratricopeptide (TPR) repeat protein